MDIILKQVEKRKKKKKYFVLLEGPSQILLGATCPPHFCIFLLYSFCSLFICCYSCAFFQIKKNV